MTVNSKQEVQEEKPGATMSDNEALSALVLEAPLMDMCCVEVTPLQAPINSTGAAQSIGDEEKIRTWHAHVSPTEETQFYTKEEQKLIPEQFVTMSEVVQALDNVCSMEFTPSDAPISSSGSTQSSIRDERTRTSGQLATLSDFYEGLENFCFLEGWNRVYSRRSPLPLWYPRRPLQDITAVLNIFPVPVEEATRFKKGSKKARTIQLHGRLYDNRVCSQQRAPRAPSKPISSEPTASKGSSLLRKGFR